MNDGAHNPEVVSSLGCGEKLVKCPVDAASTTASESSIVGETKCANHNPCINYQ